MLPRLSSFAALALVLGLSRGAAAQDSGVRPAPVDEIQALEAEMDRDAVELSGDCGTACGAFVSMERASAHLCALDPGPRCADARAKVEDAARRIQAKCGGCAGARDDVAPRVSRAESAPAAPAPTTTHVEAEVVRRRGCGGCVVGGADPGATGAAALAAVSVLAALARRRRRGR